MAQRRNHLAALGAALALSLAALPEAAPAQQQTGSAPPAPGAAASAPILAAPSPPRGPMELRVDVAKPIEINNKQPQSMLAELSPLISAVIAGGFGFVIALLSMRVARKTTSRTYKTTCKTNE